MNLLLVVPHRSARPLAGGAGRPAFLAAVVALLLAAPAQAAPGVASSASGGSSPAPVVSSAVATDLAEVARSLPRGGAMRIEGTRLEGRADVAGLDLAPFDAASPGVRFVAQTASGPRLLKPQLPTYLRGSVDGMPGSLVVISVRASGEVRGVVASGEGTWTLERSAGGSGGLRSRRTDGTSSSKRAFHCDVLDNPTPRRSAPSSSERTALRLPIAHTAQVAVELDYDYFQTFAPDPDSAVLYALDLMAFVGVLGEAELGMNVQVPFVQIWTTAADPYSGDGGPRLGQVKNRWNLPGAANCGGTDCTTIARSTTILLSSAPTGGVAYYPGLCDWWHSPTNGYSYAYVGSIGGDFDVVNPTSVWDIVATAHELGHNFGSTHTHCYNPPVDKCYGQESGCYSGPESLPPSCPGEGQGCGTIMGYCHLLSGGMDNVSLTYGAGHPFGDTPDRVPAAMISQIGAEAASAPDCLVSTGGMTELLVSRAGTGSGVVTSLPAGLHCPDACRTWQDAGSVVTLVATPGPFSMFSGWSGDADCSDGVVTLSAKTTCTATFTGTCANADCDDANPCTVDTCVTSNHCSNVATPRDPASCFAAGRSRLKIVDAPGATADKLAWIWGSGAAFAQADLGDPTADTDYTLCVYDSTASVARLATTISLPAPGAYWRSYAPLGQAWLDSSASTDGIKKLQIKTGAAGRTSLKLTAAGEHLPLPAAFSASEFFDLDSSLVLQLVSSEGRCWTSSFVSAGLNTPAGFKASGN